MCDCDQSDHPQPTGLPVMPGRVMQSPSSARASHRVTSSITTLIWSLSRELQVGTGKWTRWGKACPGEPSPWPVLSHTAAGERGPLSVPRGHTAPTPHRSPAHLPDVRSEVKGAVWAAKEKAGTGGNAASPVLEIQEHDVILRYGKTFLQHLKITKD